jgi:iron complex outermembrane recepter protein
MQTSSGSSGLCIRHAKDSSVPTLVKTIIGSLCALWMISSPVRGADAAAASDTTAETSGAPVMEEIVVTGSRIPVPANISATSPVQVMSSQEIEQQGLTDTTNVINRLSQIMINPGVDLGNNSAPLSAPGGIATADLRGLGPQRTLVLVDGRRLGPGDPNTANPNVASDLDQVPAALIERIDVVTGGASATYGSDAIAGVINFIMKKNFEGVEVDGEYGFFQHDNRQTWAQNQEIDTGFTPVPTGSLTDGEHRDLSIIMGTNVAGGNGNITGYFTYHEQDPVAGDKRDFANDEFINNADFGLPPTGFTGIGSSNSNKFTIGGSPYSVVGNQFLPYPQAGSVPPAQFNSSGYEYLQRQDERYNAGLFAHLDINDYVKPYLEFGFMNDKTNVTIAPSALFSAGNPVTADNQYLVNCNNPLLSAQEAGILAPTCTTPAAGSGLLPEADIDIARRNVEGGGRNSYYEHNNFRVVGGTTGDFLDAWKYDIYAQFAYTTFFNNNTNYLNYSSVNLALQAITGPTGTPVCASGGSCVPYNLFTQGGVTPAQLAYLYTPGTAYGQNWEEIQHVDITGDLGKYNIASPFAHDGVALNVGAERRMEALSFAPDGAELSGDLAGFSGAAVAIDKSYEVKEGIFEVRAPLVQDKPFIQDLTIDGGYRTSDYSTAGHTNTYKFEVQYAPTRDFRFRYSFDKAVRAPNLIELYNPQSYGQQSFLGVDPCAPTVGAGGVITNPATASAANCAHTGVSAAQYGNGNVAGAVYTGSVPQCISDQCGQVLGGNPNLSPETAETYSLGITFTPTFLPNFTGSIDYYHIALKNEVTAAPGAFVFNQCLATGAAQDCGLVVRNHVTGALTGATVAGGGYILQTDINGGAALVSGIDIQTNYRYSLKSWGSLSATFSGSWLQHAESTPFVGLHTYDCAGLYGAICGGPAPTWRHNLRVSWELPWSHIDVSAYWRFIGVVGLDQNTNDPSLHYQTFGEYDVIDAHIPRMSYLDLSAIWPVTSKLELRMGINNVFDKDPPIVSEDVNDGTIPGSFPTYDYLGREYFFGVKLHL